MVRYTYWYCMYVVIIGMTLVVVACILQAYAAINESRGLITGKRVPSGNAVAISNNDTVLVICISVALCQSKQ